MRVLVACEFSGRVRDAFIKRGHLATSCDLEPSETPGPHLLCDLMLVDLAQYDLLIAHPPCTYLSASGARWWPGRQLEQAQAIAFFEWCARAPVKRIAIENPVGIMSTVYRKPDQIVQPWQFGDEFQKTTCLWLKGLPKLTPTKIVGKGDFVIHGGRKIAKWYSNNKGYRTKTFPGMADAMAAQWGMT